MNWYTVVTACNKTLINLLVEHHEGRIYFAFKIYKVQRFTVIIQMMNLCHVLRWHKECSRTPLLTVMSQSKKFSNLYFFTSFLLFRSRFTEWKERRSSASGRHGVRGSVSNHPSGRALATYIALSPKSQRSFWYRIFFEFSINYFKHLYVHLMQHFNCFLWNGKYKSVTLCKKCKCEFSIMYFEEYSSNDFLLFWL